MGMMRAYALSIFAGAFLLFQVQPLIGKYILPWFGGAPGVWTACLLFFQVLLLVGYAYVHVTSHWLKPRAQAVVHLILLALALALLPIIPAASWKPGDASDPTWRILELLTVTLGVPYFALSATGPLLQQWFSLTHPGRSPYRLYALSNAGSLLALLSYPFFFEAHFTRQTQARLWAGGLVAFAAACGFCALRILRLKVADTTSVGADPPAADLRSASSTPTAAPSGLDRALWLLLPACASILLLATTNKICQDIAVLPLLWVLPLSLYLLSFIICFENPRWYARFPFTLALIAAELGVGWALFQGSDLSIRLQVLICSAALFVFCMVCHGELYRLRPAPSRLTEFYLLIAAGGALGGIFVAVVAPLIFSDYYELHCGLLLCAGLFVLICIRQAVTRGPVETAASGPSFSPQLSWQDYWRWMAYVLTALGVAGLDWFVGHFVQESGESPGGRAHTLRLAFRALLILLATLWIIKKQYKSFRHWRLVTCVWLAVGLGALGVALWLQGLKGGGEVIYMSRNFYGVLTIYDEKSGDPKEHNYRLQHGRITHGLQFVDSERAAWPTAYYGEKSGVGVALQALTAGHRRIGLVGLGTGTLATYAQPGDYLRIYEINPEVIRLATSQFRYLANSRGKIDLIPGDARLSLEREPSQQFDLLVLDAFNSDAIPVHLLTSQAFELYQRHLKPGGLLAAHISNHHLDLVPVLINAARRFNFNLAPVDYEADDDDWWLYSSTWMLLTHSPVLFNAPCIKEVTYAMKTNVGGVRLWTDDFASLAQILK